MYSLAGALSGRKALRYDCKRYVCDGMDWFVNAKFANTTFAKATCANDKFGKAYFAKATVAKATYRC